MTWTTSYYHYDALGSTRALTDSVQAISGEYIYDAYGNEVSVSGSTTNPFRYVGELGYYFDADTETANVRARVYQPLIIRWLSRDPIGYLVVSNMFEYVASHPVRGTDPSGLWMAIGNDRYVSEGDETFENLVREAAPQLQNPARNTSCIRPITDGSAQNIIDKMEAAWKQKKPAECGVYEVKNLTNADPSGGKIMASVGSDRNGYIRLASTFYGATNMTGIDLAKLMKTQSKEGNSPLESVIIVGHSWLHEDAIGGITPEGRFADVFRLRDLLRVGPFSAYSAWPKWDDAIQGRRPPLCWFRTDASVRLVGCITSSFARQWARAVLRGTSIAFGTSRPTWAFENKMGWGDRGRNGIGWVPDERAGTAGTPEDYHRMRFWVEHDAQN